jgi:site-specific DNA recombinase
MEFAKPDELGNPTKLIAIYARVSTARQEEDGTIETQLGVLREFSHLSGS